MLRHGIILGSVLNWYIYFLDREKITVVILRNYYVINEIFVIYYWYNMNQKKNKPYVDPWCIFSLHISVISVDDFRKLFIGFINSFSFPYYGCEILWPTPSVPLRRCKHNQRRIYQPCFVLFFLCIWFSHYLIEWNQHHRCPFIDLSLDVQQAFVSFNLCVYMKLATKLKGVGRDRNNSGDIGCTVHDYPSDNNRI